MRFFKCINLVWRLRKCCSIIAVLLGLLLVAGCSSQNTAKLKFSFQLNKKEEFIASNQIAIWLQNSEGNYLKTFFVCDYLSYGGYTIPDVCPNWVSKSDWQKQPGEIVDAVSQATPDVGEVVLEFDFPGDELIPGKYKYCIEVHVAENYNELYSGDIEIEENGESRFSEVAITYKPGKYEKGSGLLSNVKVEFEN